jgi:outer membrane biogenesis lipoprotein LolB
MRDCLKNNQWEKGCNGMKRKVIALILSVATMSILLTGCGESQKESGESQETQAEETASDGTVSLKVWGGNRRSGIISGNGRKF